MKTIEEEKAEALTLWFGFLSEEEFKALPEEYSPLVRLSDKGNIIVAGLNRRVLIVDPHGHCYWLLVDEKLIHASRLRRGSSSVLSRSIQGGV
jgi:hypothetical protein